LAQARAGDPVAVTVRVSAVGGPVSGVRVSSVAVGSPGSASGACATGCSLGNLAAGGGANGTVSVTVPATLAKVTATTVTVTVAGSASQASGSATVTWSPRNVVLPPAATGGSRAPDLGSASPLSPMVAPPPDPMVAPPAGVVLPSAVQTPETAPERIRLAASELRSGGGSADLPIAASLEAGWLTLLVAGCGTVWLRLRSQRARRS
jgi:hypothetical protein